MKVYKTNYKPDFSTKMSLQEPQPWTVFQAVAQPPTHHQACAFLTRGQRCLVKVIENICDNDRSQKKSGPLGRLIFYSRIAHERAGDFPPKYALVKNKTK